MNEELNKFVKDFKNSFQKISLKDLENKSEYTITKMFDGNNYVIEKKEMKIINSNEEIDKLFEEIESFTDSVKEKDYWPNTSEYPDQIVLWRLEKYGKEEKNKSGALGYPNEWNEKIQKIDDYMNNN